MEQLEQIKQFLLKRRDPEMATLIERAIEKDGYLDVQDYSGGNFDDAFELGSDVGEAQFIEELLAMLNIE
jgi:hypothetical protein